MYQTVRRADKANVAELTTEAPAKANFQKTTVFNQPEPVQTQEDQVKQYVQEEPLDQLETVAARLSQSRCNKNATLIERYK